MNYQKILSKYDRLGHINEKEMGRLMEIYWAAEEMFRRDREGKVINYFETFQSLANQHNTHTDQIAVVYRHCQDYIDTIDGWQFMNKNNKWEKVYD